MDRATMVTQIRRRLGEDVNDFWDTTDITQEIDNALFDWAREERWPWLYTIDTSRTVTFGNNTIALPADIDFSRTFVMKLRKGTEQPKNLRRLGTVEGYQQEARLYNTKGQPRYYYLVSAAQSAPGAGDETITYTVRVAPAADATYTVEFLYTRKLGPLTADNAEPFMPEEYHEAIVARATARLWEHELVGSQVKAAEQQAIYERILANAKREIARMGEDEELVWGRDQAEEELAGYDTTMFPQMPPGYGRPGGMWE